MCRQVHDMMDGRSHDKKSVYIPLSGQPVAPMGANTDLSCLRAAGTRRKTMMRRHKRNRVVAVPEVVPCCHLAASDSRQNPNEVPFLPIKDPAGGDQSMPQVGAGPATTGAALSLSRTAGVRRKAAAQMERGQRRGSQGEHEGTRMPGCQRCQLSGWNRVVGRCRGRGKRWADATEPTTHRMTGLETCLMPNRRVDTDTGHEVPRVER
ncbi:hypothetical protein V8C37DRAFT_350900 [Trichoderma ceciliae]